MTMLFDLLTLGGPSLVHWTATQLLEEAERQSLDEAPVHGELLELQQRYDAGVLEEAEYDRQERAILERLDAIRETKAQRSQPSQPVHQPKKRKRRTTHGDATGLGAG